MADQQFSKTIHLSPASSAVLDAYRMLNPKVEKGNLGNEAILKTILPQLPHGIAVELAKRHPEIKHFLTKK